MTVLVLEFFQEPVTHKGRQAQSGEEVTFFEVFINYHLVKAISEFLNHQSHPLKQVIKSVIDFAALALRLNHDFAD